MECLRVYDHSDGKGAAGKVLTVSAVTRENHKRRVRRLSSAATEVRITSPHREPPSADAIH
jgi:hypothetical protein